MFLRLFDRVTLVKVQTRIICINNDELSHLYARNRILTDNKRIFSTDYPRF